MWTGIPRASGGDSGGKTTRSEVEALMASKLGQLGCGHKDKATLAALRHGSGKPPGADPGLWGVLFEDMPEKMYGRAGKASPAEWALYEALTAFAWHQQGKEETMHKRGMSPGKAIAMLAEGPGKDSDRARNRLEGLARSALQLGGKDDGGWKALDANLRAAVRMLAGKGVPMDYVALAGDLFEAQANKERVALKWGRDFYASVKNKSKETQGTEKKGRETS